MMRYQKTFGATWTSLTVEIVRSLRKHSMTIVRVGTSKKYAEGWEQAFSSSKAPKKKTAAASAKPAPAKKAAKKKAGGAKKKSAKS
jgi:hypothetical protein